MLFWEIRNKETGKVVATEFDLGNAMEHHMVLDEMNPGVFDVFEIDEVEGAEIYHPQGTHGPRQKPYA